MSPRNQQQNEQMRKASLDRITKSALKIFAEYGYHGATLKRITRSTGLSYGLVYHYFPSKEEIFLYLVDLAFKYSNSMLKKAIDSPGSAWEKITKFSEVLAEEIKSTELPYYFIITQQAMTQAKDIPGIDRILEKGMEKYIKVEKLILEAQDSGDVIVGDPSLLSAAYLSLLQGLTLVAQHQDDLRSKITPEIFNNLLRRKN